MKKIIFSGLLTAAVLFCGPVFAQEFYNDISLSAGDVRVVSDAVEGENVRIYVTVHNNSYFDLSGVVKFYDEKSGSYISTDQPVSILALKTDDVFIDWKADTVGTHPIAVRVVPWKSDGDDPSNNKVTKNVVVDVDSDGDGIGNGKDTDDDNDGVSDINDAFPLDSSESKDTDGDGIGDNTDTDDDDDGVSDVEDAFPLDSTEIKDTDGDGTGDNSDVYPYDSSEWVDSDSDGLGDNADPDDQNKGPVPAITVSDPDVRVGQTVTFSAIKSEDADGEIEDFQWEFGDDSTDNGVIVDHVYSKAGTYIATLKVTDDKGEYRYQQIQVKVGFDWVFRLLLIVTILLLIMLGGMLHPRSKFYYKRMFSVFKKRRK